MLNRLNTCYCIAMALLAMSWPMHPNGPQNEPVR